MLNNTLQETVKIAYVEDEPSIAQLLVSGLGLFGIEVKPVFMNAEDLLTQAEGEALQEVDLFFFDIRLPKMTGLELAGKLRAQGEKRPFVLVSAWPAPTDEALDRIGAQFLPKPFDFPDVIQTIQKLTSKQTKE
ncbi:MAG: response regulator [Ardenticatenaceae bacterium]|nr:response regulator [Ardenticatenaceae bacterium]MCB8948973.1 response regulator [Ardenticatenaceae bacterium]